MRKVQETGGTYLISLPKNWANKIGIQRGSVLSLVERSDGALIVDPSHKIEKEPTFVTIKPSPYLGREITGNYLLGYDTIVIEGDGRMSSIVRGVVKDTLKRLIGLEAVEEDAHKIVLQCLLEPSSFPPEKILRREYVFALGMLKDAMAALGEQDMGLAKSVIERDDEVDRLYFLLVRLLRTIVLNPSLGEKVDFPLIDCLDYRIVANYLEGSADKTEEMAKSIIEHETVKISDELHGKIRELGEFVVNMLDVSMRGIFLKDMGLSGGVLLDAPRANDVVYDIEALLTEQSTDVISYVSGLVFSLNRIADYSVDIADLTMPMRKPE